MVVKPLVFVLGGMVGSHGGDVVDQLRWGFQILVTSELVANLWHAHTQQGRVVGPLDLGFLLMADCPEETEMPPDDGNRNAGGVPRDQANVTPATGEAGVYCGTETVSSPPVSPTRQSSAGRPSTVAKHGEQAHG